jgi:hypothetical protein
VEHEPTYKKNVPLAHAPIPNSPTTNVENIMRTPKAQTSRAKKVNRTFYLHPRGTWTIETLEEIMDIVEEGTF